MTIETIPLRPVLDEYIAKFPDTAPLLNWVYTILTTEPIRDMACIAGGFPLKIMAKLPLDSSDIDIFVFNMENYKTLTAAFSQLEFTTVIKKAKRVLTLHLDAADFNRNVQIIKGKDTVKKLFKSFDFTLCKIAFVKDTIQHHKNAISCINEQILLDGRGLHPYIDLKRVRKYCNLGFIPKGKILLKTKEAIDIELNRVVSLKPGTVSFLETEQVTNANFQHVEIAPRWFSVRSIQTAAEEHQENEYSSIYTSRTYLPKYHKNIVLPAMEKLKLKNDEKDSVALTATFTSNFDIANREIIQDGRYIVHDVPDNRQYVVYNFARAQR